jgi:hypothetical protein
MLEAGQGFVSIVPGEKEQEDGKGTHVKLDRSKVGLYSCPLPKQ